MSEKAMAVKEAVCNGQLPLHAIEQTLLDDTDDEKREELLKEAVRVRREVVGNDKTAAIPFATDLRYSDVYGRCCENVIGYIPIPVGVVVNALIDGDCYTIPMATTEGALVASTQRGFKAISTTQRGVQTHVFADGMTRAPIIHFERLEDAIALKQWVADPGNYRLVEDAFNATSAHARLQKVDTVICGTDIFLRFKASTGDAMGMNMLSKGCEAALDLLFCHHPQMKVISLSGNYCTDKKAAALNWIDGRGKSVVAAATISAAAIKEILKVNVSDMVMASVKKNFKGSALAGAIGGGFNAHAANIVSAIFIACGQDPAQCIVSSSCLTELEELADGSLRITCTMPSIEVGTIGGGTHLAAQSGALGLMDVAGATPSSLPSGEHARRLGRIICATVLAAELSLLGSLVQGTLTAAHLALNRRKF